MLTDWIIAIVIAIMYITVFFLFANDLMKSLDTDEESWRSILLDRIIISNIENSEVKRIAKNNKSLSVNTTSAHIGYNDCANAMLSMWMDNIVTDGEYNRIINKLNKHYGKA